MPNNAPAMSTGIIKNFAVVWLIEDSLRLDSDAQDPTDPSGP
jgi:hypothetical protein